MIKLKQQKGFTILELLIATLVLSILLVLCATAIVTVGRIFYKGNTENKVQQTARNVVNDIAQSVQFGVLPDTSIVKGVNDPGTPNEVKWICIGKTRYTFYTKAPKSDTRKYVLWKDQPASCSYLNISGPAAPSVDGRELLGIGMRAPNIDVVSNGPLFTVTATISYGDSDLFTDTDFIKCAGKDKGGQFCASTTINTNVLKRL